MLLQPPSWMLLITVSWHHCQRTILILHIDQVVSKVKDLLNGGVSTSDNNLQQASEPVRLLLRKLRQLVVDRDIWLRKAMIAGEEVRQLVLPGKGLVYS